MWPYLPATVYYVKGISKRDKAWIKVALKVARDSDCRQQHGAVIVKGGRIISSFPNRRRNHPSAVDRPSCDSSVHAEVGALRGVTDARGATVYVARLARSGPALSAPCDSCDSILREAGIKRVVFTTNNGIGHLGY